MHPYLAVIIQPVEGQVLDPNRCPLIVDLSPRTINYVSDLVGYHEFQVLTHLQYRIILPEKSTRQQGHSHN
jgi:hypothetical protein